MTRIPDFTTIALDAPAPAGGAAAASAPATFATPEGIAIKPYYTGADTAALGFLDGYRTGTGFNVAPVVAIIRPGFELKPDPGEVAEVFEVPLSFLMDEANHQKHSRPWNGRDRHYYAMPYGERFIWGATAGMLKNMHQRLYLR